MLYIYIYTRITTFGVEAADQVYNQTNEFVYLGGNVNRDADLSIEVSRRIRNAWYSFRKYTLKLYERPTERSPRAQNTDAQSRGTRDNAVRLRHVEPARVTRCAKPTTTSWLAALVGEITIAPTTRFYIWTRLWRREVRIISRRLYAGGGSCSRDSWRAWRIRDCRSAWCSENWCAGCMRGQGKEWMGCLLGDFRAFGINVDQWTTAAQDEGEYRRTAE